MIGQVSDLGVRLRASDRSNEGWLYLAAVKDLATMEIVGWSMSDRLKSTLCEDALKMAIRNRRPPRGLIHHSDSKCAPASCSWAA